MHHDYTNNKFAVRDADEGKCVKKKRLTVQGMEPRTAGLGLQPPDNQQPSSTLPLILKLGRYGTNKVYTMTVIHVFATYLDKCHIMHTLHISPFPPPPAYVPVFFHVLP